MLPVSSEKGYALLKRNLLKFEQRRPFDTAPIWDALPQIGRGSFNEVRGPLPPDQLAALRLSPDTSVVLRRTLQPTPFAEVIGEAWLTRRMGILDVSPKVYSMWLQRESQTHARLYVVMDLYQGSLQSLLKRRALTSAEEAVLQRLLQTVAESGYVLLDIKPGNIVFAEGALKLIDFGADHTVLAPELSCASRELLHTALLSAISICVTGRVLLSERLNALAHDQLVRFLNEDERDEDKLWTRVTRQLTHYLKDCLNGRSLWAYLVWNGAVTA